MIGAVGEYTILQLVEVQDYHFEATDAVGIDETECSLDGQAYTPCTSPVSYDRLSRTTHQVTVRATDEAGNTGIDQFTWTVGAPPSNSGSSGNR